MTPCWRGHRVLPLGDHDASRVSGAVFLVPVQVSILHTPNPALTPTNLLYNVIAIPGALLGSAARGAWVAGCCGC